MKFLLVFVVTSFISSSYVLNKEKSVFHSHIIPLGFVQNTLTRSKSLKVKRSKSRISYYSNHTATHQLTLSGDIEINPGPALRSGSHTLSTTIKQNQRKVPSPKCNLCEKGVGSNRKRLLCNICINLTHLSCTNVDKIVQSKMNANSAYSWTCNKCLIQEQPFYNITDLNTLNASVSELSESSFIDTHKSQIDSCSRLLKILHLNTQSMVSSFPEFECMVSTYNFDMYCLSETWLSDNQHLLDHVQIPGYSMFYQNRSNKRGGGVGVYLKESMKCKVRNDITKLDDQLEHLWIEIQGKNRHSNVLVGVLYQPNFDNESVILWMDRFEAVLHQVMSSWEGLLVITGT